MIDANRQSLYARLRARGLLDVVMRQLLDGERDPKAMVKWLRGESIQASVTSIYNMVRYHGLAWRLDQSSEAGHSMGLTGDPQQDAHAVLLQKLAVATFEADGLKELKVLAKISGDTAKLAQAERRVKVVEEKARREILAAQSQGAAEMDSIIADAEAMAALRAERDGLVKSKASDAERIEAIRRRMYGSAAVFLNSEVESVKGKREGGTP